MRFCMYAMTLILVSTTGCKMTADISVKASELFARIDQDMIGDLYVEVSSCSDYKDSRKPSKSILEIKETIPTVFEGARYVECFRKNFDSLAHFKIPVEFRKNTMNLGESSTVNLVFNSSKDLMIGIPRSLRNRIREMEKKSHRSVELKFNVQVENDTDSDFKFRGIAAYFGGRPYTYHEALSISGNSFVITLSDVSVSRAMVYGTTTLFRKLD